ncbi:hypothetical protein WJX72_000628 [[Myrmecia] bisecta]|uniref:Plastid lipid-associated protein/fibrillin conserved domain-containing protein n=1 Tax=[Myrmecia] bisecta TaxID=41462 RepID=A0AAW1R4L7_9CHLO
MASVSPPCQLAVGTLQTISSQPDPGHVQRAFLKRSYRVASSRSSGRASQVSTASATPKTKAANFLSLLSNPAARMAKLRKGLSEAIVKREGVESAIAALVKANPTQAPGRADHLQGKWQLLWTTDESDFARLQRRLGPVPVASLQLIGVAGGLRNDQAANVITIAGGLLSVVLTSGCKSDPRDSGRVRITPPFRIQVKLAGLPTPIAKDLDGEETFVQQLYLDAPDAMGGCLRISRVGRFGEKKVAGSTFVHVRL